MVVMFLLWEEENPRYYHFKTSQVFILTEVGRHATIECIKLQYVFKLLAKALEEERSAGFTTKSV